MSETQQEAGDQAETGTFQERYVDTGGFRTRFLDAGAPETDVVLLLHDGAWGGSSDVSWSRCIPLLAKQYRVIAPDFLGFGGSDKATFFDRSPYQPRIRQLEGLLEALGLRSPVHVVGTSFGGSVALRLLAESAFPISSVTSIGGSGGPWKTDVMKEQLSRWDGTRADLARVLRFLMDEDDHFEVQLTARSEAAGIPGHFRAVASAAMPLPESLRYQQPDPWPESVRRRHIPTLLVAGAQDQLFEPDWPEHIARIIPQAVIKRIDSLHSPNLDHPNEVAQLLLAHFAGAERKSG